MSTETHPAVSDAMREAVARLPEATYDDLVRACRQTELDNRRLASEIARLTGDMKAANEACDMAAMSGGFYAKHAETYLARAEAAEAETARLRAALEDAADALGWAATALREDSNDAAAGVTRSAANKASAALTSQEKTDV